jgi:hypothetical protein
MNLGTGTESGSALESIMRRESIALAILLACILGTFFLSPPRWWRISPAPAVPGFRFRSYPIPTLPRGTDEPRETKETVVPLFTRPEVLASRQAQAVQENATQA